MTSYLRYKQELRTVQDADDIESWITVRGNHIPIKKGQSKEEAVKSFLKGKGKSSSGKSESSVKLSKGMTLKFSDGSKQTIKSIRSDLVDTEKSTHTAEKLIAGIKKGDIKIESKYDPEFETVRKNALANGNVYGGKYTQKSKAEAYKEYKNDTSSKENMKKANEFVNGKPEYSKKQSEWMSKKPNIDLEKLRNGDIKEMDKYFKWGTTGNSDWFEEQKKKDFGSKESEYKAYNLYDENRKNRSQKNKNYLDDEISEGLLEISYNDMQFSNNVEKNRSNLIKAIKESKHDKSKQMVDIISNMPDKMLSNFPSFVKALEAATEGKAKSLKKSATDSWKRLWGKK